MRFAPQWRAIFRQRNFQNWSEGGVLCAFWKRNVLRATAACQFSTSQLQKVARDRQLFNILSCAACHFLTSQLPNVVRPWCVLYILTWKCASRHIGLQFFMSPLNTWLRTRRFSGPTFRPNRTTNQRTNAAFRDFPVSSDFRAIVSSFFWLYFSSLLFIFWL